MKRRNNRANKRRRSMKKRQRGGAEESRKQDIDFQKNFLLTGEFGTEENPVIKKFGNDENKTPLEFIFYIADNHTDPETVRENVGILEEFKKDKLDFNKNIIQRAVIKCIKDIIDEIKLIYSGNEASPVAYNKFIESNIKKSELAGSVKQFKKKILKEYNIKQKDIQKKLPEYEAALMGLEPPDYFND